MKPTLRAILLSTTLLLLPDPAAAGPAAAILGAAFATFGPLGAAIGTFTLFQSFLIRAALGLALNALTPKPRVPGAVGQGYKVTTSGSALDHQIIYGETRVGGARVFDSSTGSENKFLHRVLIFAGHEIEGFTEVYLNDYLLTVNLTTGAVTSATNGEETTTRFNDFVRIIARSGTDDQTAIPEMVSEIPEWTSAHRLRGLAYLYVRLEFNADTFPNGPPVIMATIRGRKVYDPRSGLTAWTDNAALCIRDYLAADFGLQSPDAEIDDVSVAAAANVCEQTVESEDRFTCNGAFLTNAAPADVLDGLLTSMGGLLWHAQGAWRMKPAYYTTPVLTLDEGDLRSGLRVQTRVPRRDSFNTVRGVWRGPESNWQETDYTPVSDDAFLAADGGVERSADVNLPFTTSHLRAQRIARIALRQQREQITISASFGMRGFAVQVGDVVQINNSRLGWVNKTFEVIRWTFGITDALALEVQMTLRETSADVFTNTPGSVFETNNTVLPSPYFVPGVGISTTVTQQILNEKVTNFINVDVSSSTPEFIDVVEVQFRETGTTDWIAVGTGELGRFEIIDVEPRTYDIRARGINTLGVRGAWIEQPAVDVTGKLTPPSDVTGLFADLTGGAVTLDWEPIPDLDLSHYIVRHAVEETGATWANATTAAAKVPRPASELTLPVKPGTYMVRAQDKSGNRSANFTSVVVPAESLQDFATSLSIDENGTFAGAALSNITIETDALVLTDTSGPPRNGTYRVPGILDAGSIRRFRARVDVTVQRQDGGTGLWDGIPGLFDEIPGLFDDWTGDVQFADTDVQTFISLTQDEPPTELSTWTDFTQFKAGDFFARGARFRVVLRSTSADVTPRVLRITARMEYT